MDEYIVVDGYNIIFAWPELQDLKNTSLEHARDRLIHMLANHAGFSGHRMLVVFDAHKVSGSEERHVEINGIDVFYTRQDQTADAMIERLVGELPENSRVRVVTSDGDEQRIIFGRGAYRMTPFELHEMLKQTKNKEQGRYMQNCPTEGYLENRLKGDLRRLFEQWRRKKDN